MQIKSFADMDCSVAQCLEVIGDRWSMLIIRDAFMGWSRFDQFQRRLGVPRNTLDDRLTKLVAADVMKRVRYADHPPRHEYLLTAKGRDLWPVLTAMRQWGDRHSAPDGAPLLLRHDTCGSAAEAVLACGSCREPLGPRDVTALPGPGRDLANFFPVRQN